jgi:hypothetical protein
VAGLLANQRVGDLVQYDLLDFFESAVIHQVLANCDSPCTKVALTCSSDRSVKAKAVVDERVLDEESVCKVDGLRLNRGHFQPSNSAAILLTASLILALLVAKLKRMKPE